MKIALVTNNYTPYSGGIVSSLNALMGQLHAQQHEIILITLDFLGSKHCDPIWVRRIPSVYRFRYKQNHMAVPWRAASYLDQWMQEFNPDVVHVHHPFLLGPLAVACAKKRGIRTVFTYHTMYEQYAHYVPVPELVSRPVIDRLLGTFCGQVDHIIVPSQGIGQRVHHMGYRNTTVIPSGLQEQFAKERFNPKELTRPYQLLSVGRLVPEKNIPFLLETIALLPDDYQLSLVGYGAYTEYLKNYAYNVLKLSSNQVRFVINPAKADLMNYYRQSHLFLFASQTDTQGLVLAESMACSTPVIALPALGHADLLVSGANGYLVESRGQMAQLIKQLCADPERYACLQHGAYQSAQNYNPAKLTEKIIAIYQAGLAQSRKSPF